MRTTETLAEAGSKREKAQPKIKCAFCGKVFTRMRVGLGSGGRKYCYDPQCERRREHAYSKVWRHDAYIRRQKHKAAAKKETKCQKSSA
jgi:hypothetical protein